MSRYPIHPLAEIFPALEGAELATFAEDIRANGPKEPITLYKGHIIDGRNRDKACDMTGVTPRYIDRSNENPVTLVASLNLHRRHLDTNQRGIIAAKIKEGFGDGVRMSGAAAARALNVGAGMVNTAAKVREKAIPEIVQAVERGKVFVANASRVASLPPDEQRKIAARGADAINAAGKTPRPFAAVASFLSDPLGTAATASNLFGFLQKCPAPVRTEFLAMIKTDPAVVRFVKNLTEKIEAA